DHVAGNAALARGQRQGGAVVAGGVGDHAAGGGFGIQRRHRVAGAAELERAAALQVFGLQEQGAAGQCVERARAQHRGGGCPACDARGGGEHLVGGGQLGDHATQVN